MNFQQLLKAFKAKREDLDKRQKEILKAAAEDDDGPRSLTTEEASEYDSIDTEMKSVDDHIKRLEKQVGQDASTAQRPNDDPDRYAGQRTIVKASDSAPEEHFKGQRYIQLVKARAVAQLDGSNDVPAVVKHMYGEAAAKVILKAADPVVAADVPTAPGIQDFVEILRADSMYDQLNFRRVAPHVPIAKQSVQTEAHFIGEGAAATASKWAATTTTLAPHKVVALVPQTIEAVRDNSVNSDQLVMGDMLGAIRNKVDSILLGTAAASGTAVPAGLLNLATNLATSGATYEDLTADIKGILNSVPEMLAGNVTLLMNPRLAFAIGTVRTDLGVSVFPGMSIKGGMLEGLPVKVSNAVPVTRLIGLIENEVYSIGDMGVQIAVSNEATIAGTSAFENGLVVFRAIRPVSWAYRRDDVVVYLDPVTYGETASAES